MRISPHTNLLIFYFGFSIVQSLLIIKLNTHPMIAWLPTLVFAAAAGMDVVRSASLKKGLSIRSPNIVRMTKNKETKFALIVSNHQAAPRQLKIGIFFAANKFQADESQSTRVNPGKSNTMEWPVTGLKQGMHPLHSCQVETLSLFRLWTLRYTFDLECELRVYPNLKEERKILASGSLDSGYGIHSQSRLGKGREFERLREYLPGDLYEDIHWKATARRGKPVTKIYQVERTQDVYVLIDAARLSARDAASFSDNEHSTGSTPRTILEKYITTALSVGMAAQRQGDNFGLAVFSDQMKKFIRAGNGKSHHMACRDALYTVEPDPVTPDFLECITFIGNKIRKRALLIMFTHLDDPAVAEDLFTHIDMLSRRHLVMVNMLNPADARPLFSSNDVNCKADIYDRLSGHMVWTALREMEKNFQRLGVGFFIHKSNALTFNTISHYIRIKQRQAL